MAISIGHASIDENGRVRNGYAGDQTGKEVCIRSWYKKSWTAVIRPKNYLVAEKIAKAMEQACANNNIGYDQYQRTTLYTQAKAHNWDLSKITTKCETDCSALVAVCVNAAGIPVSKDIYTGNQLQALKSTGKFDVYTSSAYTASDAMLKRGDILLSSGHTAIVLGDGLNANISAPTSTTVNTQSIDSAKSYLKTLAGTYKVTASALNIRRGAGVSKSKIITIPRGTKVKNYGYYTSVLGTKWLYIQFTYGGTTYNGFASLKYLSK